MSISFFGSGPITNQELQAIEEDTQVDQTQVNEDSAPTEEDAETVVAIMETNESAEAPEDMGEESMSISDRPSFWEETGLDPATDPITEEELENTEEREAFETINKPIGEIKIEEARRSESGETVESFPEADVGRLEAIGRQYAGTCESIVGLDVLPEEKPYIVATVMQEIRNGFGRRGLIFIRKFKSGRARPEEYRIFRKKIFLEKEFLQVGVIPGSNYIFPSKYEEYLSRIGLPKDDVLVFEDEDVEPTQVYVYLIKVKWNLNEEGRKILPDDRSILFDAAARGGFTI